MKRFVLLSFLLLSLVTLASAQALIGSRAAGMGGAGTAVSDDISAAYYNPAGLMESKANVALKISLGAAYTNPDKLVEAAGDASDPTKFILKNFDKKLTFQGTANGVVGIDFKKIGLSVIPMAYVMVNKDANSTVGTVNAMANYNTVLTLGTSFSIPNVPIGKLDVGINAKSITNNLGNITTTPVAPPALTSASGTQTISSGTGMGFDIGALTSISIPMVTNFKVGVALRDLGESVKYTPKSRNMTVDQTTNTVTPGPETTGADYTVNYDSSTAIGASAIIPAINLLVAADLEMTKTDTNTHIGIEYPMLANLLILRAGVASGPNLGLTTFGAKINLPILGIEAATVQNSKASDLSSTVVDINIGF